MWGGKHSDLYTRSDVFVQNITMHYKCLLLFLLLIMWRQKYGDGVGGLTAFSRLLVF